MSDKKYVEFSHRITTYYYSIFNHDYDTIIDKCNELLKLSLYDFNKNHTKDGVQILEIDNSNII